MNKKSKNILVDLDRSIDNTTKYEQHKTKNKLPYWAKMPKQKACNKLHGAVTSSLRSLCVVTGGVGYNWRVLTNTNRCPEITIFVVILS